MRKIYAEPQMEVVIVSMRQQLMAGSVTGNQVLEEMAGEGVPGMSPEMMLDIQLPDMDSFFDE